MKHSTITFCVITLLFFSIETFAQEPAPLGSLLGKKYPSLGNSEEVLVLISLKDKGAQRLSAVSPRSILSERAISRRAKVRPATAVIDEQDIPLEQTYVRAVANIVARTRHQLKWFNAISAMATKEQIEELRALPFVREVELIGRWRTSKELEKESPELPSPLESNLNMVDSLNYGTGLTQVNQINVPAVHNMGIYGQGIIVGVFDNGFRLPGHESFASMNIIATYDFVDHKKSVVPNNPSTSFGSHGVNTLSTIGGYKSGQLIGPAFGSTYILARTENDSSETPVEEDNWAKAIEWADSIGVDVTSTSLGYIDYDAPYASWTWQDMNGNTTLITRAADRAAGLGIVVVNSAGNEGSSSHNTLGAPADGDSVISIGAVDASGTRSSFSSVGPTTDVPARIKPDVMAMGSGVKVASSTNTTGYGTSSGTSFSCPLSAGVAALILCANPELTPMQVREAMRQTANNAGSPNNSYGWGILNARNAISYYGIAPSIRGSLFNDLDADGIKDTNETGIAGTLVYLAGTITDSTYTDSKGEYLFTGLSVGSFSVTPSALPSDKKVLFPSNKIYNITIDSAHLVQSAKNFSIVEYATVSGSVYEDVNGNGSKQPSEPPVSGWKVKLGSGLSTLTDSSGSFLFLQADAGMYALSESLQTGWMQTAPAGNYSLNLSFGQSVSGYAFGIFKKGSIQGIVFQDFNSNGVQDSSEAGVAGWTIQLNGPVNTTTVTDSNGVYTFSNLPAGTYTVSQTPVDEWLQTYPESNGTHSAIITSGVDTSSLDFGNYFAPMMTYGVQKGWNLLSLPQYISENTIVSVYPSALSQAFTFDGAYVPHDTVPGHSGYWLKFANAQNVPIVGDLKTADTVTVTTGWNMVGSLSDPISALTVTSQPDSIIVSEFYSYSSNGYAETSTIAPHKGYWVKVNNNGILILNSASRTRELLQRKSLLKK